MNADVQITFLGGPLDGRTSRVGDLAPGQDELPDEAPVKLKSMDARQEPMTIRKGQYQALTIHRRNGEQVTMADERGNLLYRWTGWEA